MLKKVKTARIQLIRYKRFNEKRVKYKILLKSLFE